MRRAVDRAALYSLAREMERCIYLAPHACAKRHAEWARRLRGALGDPPAPGTLGTGRGATRDAT